jgi:hypothetical protein
MPEFETPAVDANEEEIAALARLFAELTNGIGIAERDHLGYVRMTVPVAHAKPAEALLRRTLTAVHDGLAAARER